MKTCLLALLALSPLLGIGAVERFHRAPRHERGDTNVRRLQPIDDASWVWHPAMTNEPALAPERYLRFRRRFEARGEELRFDVSADERFVLFLDGRQIARGPGVGIVSHWPYQSYRADLAAGAHVVEAVVWKVGKAAPFAHATWRGGFVFKAEGAYDELLTTGKAEWEVGELAGTHSDPTLPMAGAWGGGDPYVVRGTGILTAQPDEWRTAIAIREPISATGQSGCLRVGWMLFPSELPDQLEVERRPGRFCRGGEGCSPERPSFTVRPGERRTLLWDLGDYHCAYPVARTSGGRGARISWGWAEAMRDPARDNRKSFDRNAWRDRVFDGFVDVFLPDGRAEAEFTTPWWRCGRWCEITVEAGEEPVEIRDLHLVESRYPVEDEAAFACDDPTLADVRRLCTRGMQMCDHEMLFDCPFYEQQMYPGDTRTQLMTLSALSRDDRMIRHAIEIFDFGRRDNGMIPMNYPSRGEQESVTYSMCHLLMYGDYVMRHDDRAWLAARLPGMRHTLFGISRYEDEEGLIRGLPGWSFVDCVDDTPGWHRGAAPDGESRTPSGLNNLFWALALRSAARVERAMGDEAMAAIWEAKAERTGRALMRRFWNAGRGLMADTIRHDRWSEHAQCLAILSGVLSGEDAKRAFAALETEKDLAPCSVYFSYYLFETYFRFGRGDLFLRRLDLWRDYVKQGLRTPLERPDKGRSESRSDCHAWGSHPVHFMEAGLAGVMPDAPFFSRVRVAPAPGDLKFIRCRVPHPKGFVVVDLRFAGGKASGTVTLPDGVPGRFVWQGRERALRPGANELAD